MNNKINIGKYIKISMNKDYKKWEQYIFGITINKEYECFANNSLYDDVKLKRAKYEFNIWLVLISFHIQLYGKSKQYTEE